MRFAAFSFAVIALLIAGSCMYFLWPLSWPAIGLCILAGIVLTPFVALSIIAALLSWASRHPSPLPPVPPTVCPTCAGTDHEWMGGGLWDGNDRIDGSHVCGKYSYGICRKCAARWAQWDDAPPYVTSPEEWEREIAGPARRRAEELATPYRWVSRIAETAPTLATPSQETGSAPQS